MIRLEIEADLVSTVEGALCTRAATLRAGLDKMDAESVIGKLRRSRITMLENLIFELRRSQALAEFNTKEKHG